MLYNPLGPGSSFCILESAQGTLGCILGWGMWTALPGKAEGVQEEGENR